MTNQNKNNNNERNLLQGFARGVLEPVAYTATGMLEAAADGAHMVAEEIHQFSSTPAERAEQNKGRRKSTKNVRYNRNSRRDLPLSPPGQVNPLLLIGGAGAAMLLLFFKGIVQKNKQIQKTAQTTAQNQNQENNLGQNTQQFTNFHINLPHGLETTLAHIQLAMQQLKFEMNQMPENLTQGFLQMINNRATVVAQELEHCEIKLLEANPTTEQDQAENLALTEQVDALKAELKDKEQLLKEKEQQLKEKEQQVANLSDRHRNELLARNSAVHSQNVALQYNLEGGEINGVPSLTTTAPTQAVPGSQTSHNGSNTASTSGTNGSQASGNGTNGSQASGNGTNGSQASGNGTNSLSASGNGSSEQAPTAGTNVPGSGVSNAAHITGQSNQDHLNQEAQNGKNSMVRPVSLKLKSDRLSKLSLMDVFPGSNKTKAESTTHTYEEDENSKKAPRYKKVLLRKIPPISSFQRKKIIMPDSAPPIKQKPVNGLAKFNPLIKEDPSWNKVHESSQTTIMNPTSEKTPWANKPMKISQPQVKGPQKPFILKAEVEPPKPKMLKQNPDADTINHVNDNFIKAWAENIDAPSLTEATGFATSQDAVAMGSQEEGLNIMVN